jgi:hypothetical protein
VPQRATSRHRRDIWGGPRQVSAPTVAVPHHHT